MSHVLAVLSIYSGSQVLDFIFKSHLCPLPSVVTSRRKFILLIIQMWTQTGRAIVIVPGLLNVLFCPCLLMPLLILRRLNRLPEMRSLFVLWALALEKYASD
uniref:Uncharacterized protein n=1 Tax=Opuntia streptacantha TaxID=393608 RepID=A0A7C8YWG9_OPUST